MEAAQRAGLDVSRNLPVNHLVRELIRQGIFSDEALPVFNRLRQLRNEAVHAPDFAVEQPEVERYVDLALRLEQDLLHAGNALGLLSGTVNFATKDG